MILTVSLYLLGFLSHALFNTTSTWMLSARPKLPVSVSGILHFSGERKNIFQLTVTDQELLPKFPKKWTSARGIATLGFREKFSRKLRFHLMLQMEFLDFSVSWLPCKREIPLSYSRRAEREGNLCLAGYWVVSISETNNVFGKTSPRKFRTICSRSEWEAPLASCQGLER